MLSVLNVTGAFYSAIIHCTKSIIKKTKTIHHALLSANKQNMTSLKAEITYKGHVGAVPHSSATLNGWQHTC